MTSSNQRNNLYARLLSILGVAYGSHAKPRLQEIPPQVADVSKIYKHQHKDRNSGGNRVSQKKRRIRARRAGF